MDTGYAQKKRCRDRNHGVSPEGGKGSLGWKGFVEQVGFERGVKKRSSDGWREWRVDGGKWGSRCRRRCVGVRVVGARLSESSRELVPETR